jgi:hypothetical protein
VQNSQSPINAEDGAVISAPCASKVGKATQFGARELERPNEPLLCGLRNQPSLVNLVRGCVPGTGLWNALLFQPRLSNRALDNMSLDPAAFWARKRSQVLTRRTRFNCRKLHGRAASGALRTLVLCIEHVGFPLIGRCDFAGKPSDSPRIKRVRCDNSYFNMIALGAFEKPVFKADWAR